MMRKLEVNDIGDIEDLKNAFSITVKYEILRVGCFIDWGVSGSGVIHSVQIGSQ